MRRLLALLVRNQGPPCWIRNAGSGPVCLLRAVLKASWQRRGSHAGQDGPDRSPGAVARGIPAPSTAVLQRWKRATWRPSPPTLSVRRARCSPTSNQAWRLLCPAGYCRPYRQPTPQRRNGNAMPWPQRLPAVPPSWRACAVRTAASERAAAAFRGVPGPGAGWRRSGGPA